MKHIILIGFMGAGKTTLGHVLAKKLHLPFVDTDHYIAHATGQSVQQIFKESGEAAFRRIEQATLQEVVRHKPSVISTGGGMPCFFDNMQVMNEAGTTVYLQASPADLALWLNRSTNKRPLIANMSEPELFHYVRETLALREVYYLQAKIYVNAYSADAEELADQVIRQLATEK